MAATVRARHMECLLEAVQALDGELSNRIYELVSSDLLDEVRFSTPSAWLPLRLNVEFADAIAGVLGPLRSKRFFREMLLREYESSLFKTFIDGVTRAFGVSPAVFVKMAPKGWELVYRECGKLTPLEVGDETATLLFSQVPAMCVRNSLWLDAVRSTFYTAFDLARVPGDIEWDELDLVAQRAVFRFRWG